MDQLIEFFREFLNTNDWPARWSCGRWTEFHGWLYIISDMIIWLAYFIIPVILVFFIQKRPNISFRPVFWLFVAFILLCGTTHLLDAIIFWWPAYRLSAFVRLLTSIVSMLTVFALINILPKALGKNFDVSETEKLLEEKDIEIMQLKNELSRLKR